MWKPETRQLLIVLLVVFSALAWLVLWLWGQSPFGQFLGHHSLTLITEDISPAPVFLIGWIVMIIAMMLPGSLPLIVQFDTLTRERSDHLYLLGWLIAGDLCSWMLFGGLVYVGSGLFRQIIEHSLWLEINTWMFGALMAILAGLYQLTRLKTYCRDKCCSVQVLIANYWQRDATARRSLVLGLRHGWLSIGCCWLLMLLMFAVSAGSIGWMLILSVVMMGEKNLAWGRQLSIPLGTALLAGGVMALIFAAP